MGEGATAAAEIGSWFRQRVPGSWFASEPHVAVDRDEILVVGALADEPDLHGLGPVERARAVQMLVEGFREGTRDARTAIARDAELLFARKVSWGVDCAGERRLFTHLSLPVMTRLRMPEREVLDTLVDANVARSRSEALAWCVRLVGQHEGDWIADLRTALVDVERVRTSGPGSRAGGTAD
jgi:hypothetical protein